MIEQPIPAAIGISMMTAAVIWMSVHYFRDSEEVDEQDETEDEES
jgi:hypothetical protein